MEPEGSLPCSQEPTTGPYPDIQPYFQSYIILPFYATVFWMVSSLPGFPNKIPYGFPCYMPHPSNPHYAVFSSLLPLPPSEVRISP
jgi:hypothetical protein